MLVLLSLILPFLESPVARDMFLLPYRPISSLQLQMFSLHRPYRAAIAVFLFSVLKAVAQIDISMQNNSDASASEFLTIK